MQKIADQALPIGTALLALATLGWFIFGLNRGLELTDESYYVLSAIHADQIGLFFSPTHWVSGWLWQLSQSLVAFRAWGLALVVASSGVLAWGALKMAIAANLVLLPASRSCQAALFASAASAALLYGSLLNFTPSYNLLAASGACFAAGLGLWAIAENDASDKKSHHAWLLAALCGIALGITVLCKFSSGISTAAWLVGIALVWLWLQPARLWPMLLKLGVMLAGAVATVLLAMQLQTGMAEAVRQFQAGVALVWFAQGDHSTLGRLLRSAADMAGLLKAVVLGFWWPLAFCALAAFCRPLWMRGLGLGLGLAGFMVLLIVDKHLDAGTARFALQAQPLLALLLALLLVTARAWLRPLRAVVLVLALLVLPIGIAIGTWNPLQMQILTALAPWGVLAGLLQIPWRGGGVHEPRLRWAGAFFALLFSAVVLLQSISSANQPYRIPARALQTEPVAIGALGRVTVDAKTAALVRAMQAAGQRCQIQPGQAFVDLYNLPAVGLMLGLVPVVSPWLLNADYANIVLGYANPALLQGPVVVVIRRDDKGALRLPTLLAHFPAGFQWCGQGIAPMDGAPVELWVSRLL